MNLGPLPQPGHCSSCLGRAGSSLHLTQPVPALQIISSDFCGIKGYIYEWKLIESDCNSNFQGQKNYYKKTTKKVSFKTEAEKKSVRESLLLHKMLQAACSSGHVHSSCQINVTFLSGCVV